MPEDSHYIIELNHTVLVLLLLYIEHVKFCHINEIFCTILYIVCEPKNYLLVYKIIKNLTPNTFTAFKTNQNNLVLFLGF